MEKYDKLEKKKFANPSWDIQSSKRIKESIDQFMTNFVAIHIKSLHHYIYIYKKL